MKNKILCWLGFHKPIGVNRSVFKKCVHCKCLIVGGYVNESKKIME